MWEELYFKQSAKVINYQREGKQKEEELAMLRKKTTSLQLELRHQSKIFTSEKAVKEKIICDTLLIFHFLHLSHYNFHSSI